jgi:hypothetical protein
VVVGTFSRVKPEVEYRHALQQPLQLVAPLIEIFRIGGGVFDESLPLLAEHTERWPLGEADVKSPEALRISQKVAQDCQQRSLATVVRANEDSDRFIQVKSSLRKAPEIRNLDAR